MKKYIAVFTIVAAILCAGSAIAGSIHALNNVTGLESTSSPYTYEVRRMRVLAAHVVFGNATGAVDFYQSANDGANYQKFKTYSTAAQEGVYDLKTQAPGMNKLKAIYRKKYAVPYDNLTGVSYLNPANLWINYEKD